MIAARKYVYVTFLGLLLTTFVMSHSMRVIAADNEKLPASAEDVTPLQAGDRAPAFTVRTVDDEPFVFNPDKLSSPAMCITFRGGWCPYCNMHLSELRTVIPELTGRGLNVYFLSGDRPAMLYASLQQETQGDIEGMGYTILSDADINAARAFGVAFRAANETIERRSERGQDIAGSSMMNFQALPVPAVYVIDSSGKITFSYVNADYRVRIPTEELVLAANAVLDQD
jgi:peroxiredoxin